MHAGGFGLRLLAMSSPQLSEFRQASLSSLQAAVRPAAGLPPHPSTCKSNTPRGARHCHWNNRLYKCRGPFSKPMNRKRRFLVPLLLCHCLCLLASCSVAGQSDPRERFKHDGELKRCGSPGSAGQAFSPWVAMGAPAHPQPRCQRSPVPSAAVPALLAQRDAITNWEAFAQGNGIIGFNESTPVCDWKPAIECSADGGGYRL